MRLLISRDISLNPGPDKCYHCSKGISRKHRVLDCSYWEKHYHVKCSGANPKQLKSIQATKWICNAYLLRNLSFSNEVTLNILLQCEQRSSYLNAADVDESPDLANITPQASKRCVIGNLNINSLPSKFLEVQDWIGSFDILSIQETKIDSTFPNSQFSVQGYNLYRRDRKKGGGGIVVYVRNSIPPYQLKTNRGEVEAILIDIQLGQQHFSLLSAYKPPSVENEIFRRELSALLDLAISNRPDVICVGDLNCDLLHPMDNGKQGRELLDVCDVYDLYNLITGPTRISSSKESCLDVILSNVPSIALKSGTADIGLSDHMLIYAILNKELLKPKARLTKRRCFKKFNDEEFNKDLQLVPFHAA